MKNSSATMWVTPGRDLSGPDFLRALFLLLDEFGLRYCVLHSWEGLPSHLPSDLDLAVHPQDQPKLALLFRQLLERGYQPVQSLNYFAGAYYFVFSWLESGASKFVAVDIIFEHRRSGLILASGESLVAGRRRYGEFWIPDESTEFAYLIAKKTWKGKISERQAAHLKVLVEQIGRASAEQLAGKIFLGDLNTLVVHACCEGSLDQVLKRVQYQPRVTSLVRHPLNLLRFLFAEAQRVVRRWFHPTGLFVAVFGPDGAGKSTLIDNLVRQVGPAFRRYRVFHWRPMLLWRRNSDGPVTDPHARPGHPLWWSVARAFAHLMDYWLGYALVIRPLLARSGLVIFDRYFEDLLVDSKRYRYGGPLWLMRLLRPLTPKPDLVFILDAPEEIILSRKREVTLEEVKRQRERYVALAKDFACSRILAADLPISELSDQASSAVAEYLSQRFRRREGDWLKVPPQSVESPRSDRVSRSSL
jgi:thymidylate kinase